MPITFLTNEDGQAFDDRIKALEEKSTGSGDTDTGGSDTTTPDSGGNADQSGLTTAQIEALHGMFKVCAYDDSKDVSGAYAAFKTAFGITDSGEEEPDEPVTPEKTLSSISATYSGGDVAVGTAVTGLTGIVVTAYYSDSTSETVTDYTLSGTIAEGENTIAVSYGGKTASFTVTGVAESDGETTEVVAMTCNNSHSVKTFYSDGGDTEYSGKIGNSGSNSEWRSDETFTEDTEVTISVLYGQNNSGLPQCAACYLSEDVTKCYYTEQIGTASLSEYQYKYTVRAGHRLLISNYNSGKPTSITVTKEA